MEKPNSFNLNEDKRLFTYDKEKLKQILEDIRKTYNIEKIEKFLKLSFNAFDHNKSGEIALSDLKDCIYGLNLCPTEAELKELQKMFVPNVGLKAKKVVKPTVKTGEHKIKYHDFRLFMMPILLSGLYKCKPENYIIKAFEVLNSNVSKYGYIIWTDLENCLVSYAEKFNEEEIKTLAEFLQVGNNKQMGINYKDYAKHLKIQTIFHRTNVNLKDAEEEEILWHFGYKPLF